MIAAVIPTRNEGMRLEKVITNLIPLPFNILIPVINGCIDNTLDIISKFTDPKIQPVYFNEPLGIDIPRAVGAKRALELSATSVIFVDGDMTGNLYQGLLDIINSLEGGQIDMALTDCYKQSVAYDSLAQLVLRYRIQLNRVLDLEKVIGVASPSHGPHGLSRKLITEIGYESIAIPPLSLALAKAKGFNIQIAAKIPHQELGSPYKGNSHSELIAETIIGDCIQAINTIENKSPSRGLKNRTFQGYHNERRWDILNQYISGSK